MASTKTPDYPRGLTFEKVWAMFKETDLKFQETDRLIKELREEKKEIEQLLKENARQIKETDRQMKETDRQMKETAEQMKETDRQMKETDRQMKETDHKMGYLNNRFGELAEHLVGPSIMDKFNKLGFFFTRASNNCRIKEPITHNLLAEIDILLENGDIVIAVEVKSKPKEADVDKHVKRLEILREAANRHRDERKYRGAIAGAIMGEAVREYILQNGFYLIEQSGDTVKLTIPDGFIPRDW